MPNINIFVEDVAHEDFLTALIQPLANEYNVMITLNPSSVRGSRGTVITELKQYLRDLQKNKEDLPDLVIVGTDSNCERLMDRENEIKQVTSDLMDLVITMIPEPHIERWFLLDSEAFKEVYGKGCQKPDQKCERDRYKKMLLNAIYQATKTAPIDGTERIDELVNAMDFQRLIQSDRSIRRFLTPLHQQFRIWQEIVS